MVVLANGTDAMDPIRGRGMSTDTKQILESALVLSPTERAAIIESLIASLDQPDARIDELWAHEVEDRLANFESGRMKSISADEVLREFEDL
jgi:putative addiction module component (TIGR02574 family)